MAFARAGRHDDARSILEELDAESKKRYVSPEWSSVIYAAMGDKERSLAYLKQAWDVRAIQLIWMAVDPNFDPLRDEPDFKEILSKLDILIQSEIHRT